MGYIVTTEDGLLPWFVAMAADIIWCLLFEKLLVWYPRKISSYLQRLLNFLGLRT